MPIQHSVLGFEPTTTRPGLPTNQSIVTFVPSVLTNETTTKLDKGGSVGKAKKVKLCCCNIFLYK